MRMMSLGKSVMKVGVWAAVAALFGVAGQAAAADFEPAEGLVFSKVFDQVRVHDYVSKSGSAAQVVETDTLVVLDVPGNDVQNKDFKAFVQSLGKPVDAIIISHKDAHHWVGTDVLFPGIRVYSVAADSIAAEGKGELEAMKKQGAIASENVPSMTQLDDGVRTFAGVEYQFTTLPDLQAVIIRLPAQKVAIVHHLGYADVHVPMLPFEPRLAQLQALEKTGYTWIMGGHGTPRVAKEFVAAVGDYYAFVADITAKAASVDEAKQAILAKYPSYYSAFLLDFLLPSHMSEKVPGKVAGKK